MVESNCKEADWNLWYNESRAPPGANGDQMRSDGRRSIERIGL